MANVFKVAKSLQRAQPRKYANWQKAIKAASRKVKKSSRKKRTGRAGAVKFIERGETTRTRAKKVYRVKRSKTGNYKGMKRVNGVKSPAQHMKAAREGLGQQFGNLALKQMLAPTKTKRKSIGKKLAAIRSRIKRLQ